MDCVRLGQSIDRHGEKFLSRVFTPRERDYCQGRKNALQHYSGRFAAKEAILKVLGTGWSKGIAWTDMEILNTPEGKPLVELTGRCLQVAEDLGVAQIHISISHIATHAIASAIGVSAGEAS